MRATHGKVSIARALLGAREFVSMLAIDGPREARFAGWLAVLSLIATAISFIGVVALTTVLAFSLSVEAMDWFQRMVAFGSAVPAAYVLARLSLILPATALDHRVGLRWAWARSRGNGWRLLVVVGVLPWALGFVLSRVDPAGSFVAFVLLAVLGTITLVVEISALSLAFWTLCEDHVPGPQPNETMRRTNP